ncbi:MULTISPECIES: protein YgfX [unclassified Vibrio]|uniref:Protein YgfX n=1 Tax=Vibrio sp. HB236076 TaxID=3232307 RepID=A0AB39HBG4_9VIBR|nr:protein YgfX [Vibrio sp. HB161653]MDP5253946.1 hypothetical protein [Vibrio sp. HB161653]
MAKSVNLQVEYSSQAGWANVIVCLMLAHALVVCDLPLLATLILLSIIAQSLSEHRLLPKPFDGHLRVQGGRLVRIRQKSDSSATVFTLLNAYLGLRYFLLVLVLSDGKTCYLWRDSCSDEQYRRLILFLKQSFRERKNNE